VTAAVFGHGQLRLVLLALLDEREQHGYDLMQGLSDRFGGSYVPSAGTVYPRLAKLEEEGLVVGRSDGRRTVYAITAAGRAELASRRQELEGIEEQVGDSVRRLANEVRATVGDAMRSLRADLAAASAGATGTTHPTGPGRPRRDERPGRAELGRAEVHLAEFRAQLHADLKAAAAAGRLTDDAVRRLAVRLDDLRRELQASLRG
jgi:DNA-binding PadR family transcriptional regulator